MTDKSTNDKQESIRRRVTRGTTWTILELGGSQGLRLVSNLALTRILFPEAFGLMALVQIILTGLQLFSDTGVRTSIIQHARGDDPVFLDTAWTVQVIRGGLLWLAACGLALPMAWLYDEPVLSQIIPVAGVSVLVAGFMPTAVHTASRHIRLARLTVINLVCRTLNLTFTVALAFYLESVWALAVGNVTGTVLRVVACWLFLPGAQNRFALERAALGHFFHFGKYVFLSTMATFVTSQGDRAILGLFISLSDLGVFSIGFFLATLPVTLLQALNAKIVLPLYRLKPMETSERNREQIFRMRRLLALGMVALAAVLAFGGPAIVDLLYDDRYGLAGAIVTLYALSLVPALVLNTVPSMLLGAGDSRRAFYVNGATGVTKLIILYLGASHAGMFGAIVASGLSVLVIYPMRLAFARRYRAFDPLQDIGIGLLGFLICGSACVLHWEKLLELLP